MFFVIEKESDYERLMSYLKKQGLDKPLGVEIKEYVKNRRNTQNRTYWLWLDTLAEHIGYDKRDKKQMDELHTTIKVRFLGTKERVIDGKRLIEPVDSHTLNVKEFAVFMNKVEMLAHELKVILPYPDDYGR